MGTTKNKMEARGSFGSGSPHKFQHLYKKNTPNWKDNYRKRCLSRLKSNRHDSLNKFRKLGDALQETAAGSGSESVDSLMAEEWNLLRNEITANELTEEELHQLHSETRAELLAEESRIWAQYESSFGMEEEETMMSAASYEHEDEAVICPLCQKNCLSACGNNLTCPCGLNITTAEPCLSLRGIQQNLQAGVDNHGLSCLHAPGFGVMSNFGASNILMTCQVCDYMFIVI